MNKDVILLRGVAMLLGINEARWKFLGAEMRSREPDPRYLKTHHYQQILLEKLRLQLPAKIIQHKMQ